MQISDLIARLAIDADYLDRFSGERTAIAKDIRDAIAALSLPVQPVAYARVRDKTQPHYDDVVSPNSQEAEMWAYDLIPLYANPVPPTKGPEDDLIAALEKRAKWHKCSCPEPCDDYGVFPGGCAGRYREDYLSLLALRSRPASALPVVGEDALTELAKHRNWELSCGEDPQIEGEMRWQVHSVNGGRNDREWTLIGTGDTPEAAIRSAIIPSVQP